MWQVILDNYHRQQKPIFEYRWRRKPFSSLIKSWWATMRPTKFWSQIDMHDPPFVMPLISMACIQVIIFHVTVAFSIGVYKQIEFMQWIAEYKGNPNYARIRRWYGTSYDIFLSRLQEVFDTLLMPDFVIALIVWMICSYLTLLIFQQSMHRFKVRNVHLVRVWAYSFPMIPLLMLAMTLCRPFALGRMYVRYPQALPSIIFIFAILLVVRSIQVAYKLYLHIPHSWAVAICTQMIAFMASLTALLIARWGW